MFFFKSGKLLWKTNLEGGIASNPFCESNRIYVASIVGTCFCVDANDGTIIWKYAMESPIFGSACIVGSNLVCWASVSGKICCLSQENGKLVNVTCIIYRYMFSCSIDS